MSTKSLSYIDLPAAEIKRIAQACLERIAVRRARDDDDIVAAACLNHERSWWRRLTKGPIPSDEQIREELRDHEFARYFFPSMYAWGSKDVATKLLRLAEHAVVVHVTADDLDMIA